MSDWLDHVAVEIDGVDSDISRTVRDVSGRFMELAGQAGEQSQRVEHVLGLVSAVDVGDGRQVQMADVVGNMGDTLSAFAQEVLNLSKQAVVMVRTVDGILEKLSRLESLVAGIDRVTAKTNLLALNARIEAERAGEAGRSFNVVAGEVRDLSRTTSSLADDIKLEIGSIAGALRGAHEHLATVASIDMSREIDAKEEVERMLETLVERDRRMAELANASMTGARTIEGAVAGIITDMQFEDRVHQQLARLSTSLRTGQAAAPAQTAAPPEDDVTLF